MDERLFTFSEVVNTQTIVGSLTEVSEGVSSSGSPLVHQVVFHGGSGDVRRAGDFLVRALIGHWFERRLPELLTLRASIRSDRLPKREPYATLLERLRGRYLSIRFAHRNPRLLGDVLAALARKGTGS